MSDRGALWLVAGSMIGLQVWASIVLIAVSPTGESLLITAATKWPFVVIAILLVVGPIVAWLRLAKARARRARLQREEWMVDARAATPREGQWPLWETVARLERRA